MEPASTLLCPLCKGANQCASAATLDAGAPCWCFSVPISQDALAKVPFDKINKACLCARCAAGLDLDEKKPTSPPVR